MKKDVHRPQSCNFIQKEALGTESSGEFCEICKNTFFTEHLWTTAFKISQVVIKRLTTSI